LEATADSGAGAIFVAEVFYNFGAPTTPFEFDAWENYETCATCALLFDCPDVTDIDVDVCTTFEVFSGTLDVTVNASEATGPFVATLTNARAREVTLDTDTFISTPVENGRIWCIDAHTIDVTSEAPAP
jgi:hypothetical protein